MISLFISFSTKERLEREREREGEEENQYDLTY